MFRLQRKQRICKILTYEVGGQPGELPTVLIGNVFYKGMPEVSNHKAGSFEKETVLRWIRLAERFSDKSGVPHFLDIMAMYPQAMEKYVTFTAEQTETPFLIDGANTETRLAALSLISQLGLEKQAIFNGISPTTSQTELTAIRDSNIDAAILLAHNELDYSPEGRIGVLQDTPEQPGLVTLSEGAGIKKMLIDTIVFDVPSISYASEAIRLVKAELGYPAGCSPANATYSWKEALKDSILNEGFSASNVSAHTIAQCWGADYLIYGPIKQARHVITACALNDAVIAYYAMKRFGIKPLVKSHPLHRIF